MIKILYIINDFEDISLNQNALRIARSLPADKFKSYVLSLRNNGVLKPYYFRTFKDSLYVANGSFSPGVFRTAGIIKKYNIGIVHTQTLRADYTLFFAKLLLKLNNTKVLHIANRRNYFFISCEPNFLIKNILYFLSCHVVNFNICVAQHLRRKLVSRLLVPEAKVVVIPNGVDSQNISKKQYKANNPPVVTYTGQLIKRKNVMLLLKALKLVKFPFRCWIIGDGPEKDRLKEYARRHNLKGKVIFQVHTRNVAKFLSKTDILVLPSLAEGLSMSLLEAMSFAIPCVVSDIDANRELITHFENGLIFPKKREKILGENIELLLTNKELKRKLGMKSYLKMKKDYDELDTLRKYQQFYCAVSKSVT